MSLFFEMFSNAVIVLVGSLFVWALYVFIVWPIGTFGLPYVFLRAVRSDDVGASDLFAVFDNYWNVLGAAVIMALISLVMMAVLGGMGVAFASFDLALLHAGQLSAGMQILAWTTVVLFVVSISGAMYVHCRLWFTVYIVLEENTGPVEAVKRSWRRTKGNVRTLIAITLLSVPVMIAGLIFFGVGAIPASLLVGLAFAGFYASVESR